MLDTEEVEEEATGILGKGEDGIEVSTSLFSLEYPNRPMLFPASSESNVATIVACQISDSRGYPVDDSNYKWIEMLKYGSSPVGKRERAVVFIL